ncbi:hypothetical protein BC828DRAFT_392512 [Blastocladiella britannica]|nr:hypothetical protein BC828DRAFT_392512 [Blastocladiella britannica]
MCLAKQAAPVPGTPSEAIQLNNSKIAEITATLNGLVSRSGRILNGAQTVQEALTAAGLAELFPLIAGGNAAAGKLDMRFVTVLNQVVTLALQLRRDVSLTNHKYMAHQVALLYQSLTGSREDLKAFRTEIEGHFDSIKAECNAPDAQPQLAPETRQWLEELTTKVLTAALFQGRQITPSQQGLDFLRKL